MTTPYFTCQLNHGGHHVKLHGQKEHVAELAEDTSDMKDYCFTSFESARFQQWGTSVDDLNSTFELPNKRRQGCIKSGS
jgi:hypothetical protein